MSLLSALLLYNFCYSSDYAGTSVADFWQSINNSCNHQSNDSESVTLVSAFFDIGRENFQSYPRSQRKYFRHFRRWARIKNKLIVFCQNKIIKRKILEIRSGYDLEKETKVFVIKDFFSIEKDKLNKMRRISNSSHFLDFRIKKNATENIAEYNYINLMKAYFMYRAGLEVVINTDNVAWIDFGFDHGGELYSFEEDWSFFLKCDTFNKVSLFYLPPKLDKRPMFEIIRKLYPDSITGSFFICPRKLLGSFWASVRESWDCVLDLGLMDDDQPILLLASRNKPKLFNARQSDWFLPIKQYCNGGHLRVRR